MDINNRRITVLTLRSLLQRQAQFTQFLSSNKSLTASRYFRLMALAGVELICTVPLSVFQIYLNATASPLSPWRSWADTHSNFSRVVLLPAVIWSHNRTFHIAVEVGRWAPVFCAVIFFLFFGFANECRNNYRKLSHSVLLKCRITNEDDRQISTKPSGAPKLVSIDDPTILRVTNNTFLQAPTAHFAIDPLFAKVSSRLPNSKYHIPFRIFSREGFRLISIGRYWHRALSQSLQGRIRHWESITRSDFWIPFIPSILEVNRRLQCLANPASSPDLNSRHDIHTHPTDVPLRKNALYAVNQTMFLTPSLRVSLSLSFFVLLYMTYRCP